ncbi:hypothetical protein HIM_07955 [Hirsutella minnesotensis 3608]|uniref:Mid2 domain-containing protein n=1 Tax=Hirsutella minnesotensis 3608 TaxID=1043627 RepID=A0A0F7ZHG4_9HYPO|nr:hypothetical protein HIM_07955 [Hirsutella minnesotensis 3608]
MDSAEPPPLMDTKHPDASLRQEEPAGPESSSTSGPADSPQPSTPMASTSGNASSAPAQPAINFQINSMDSSARIFLTNQSNQYFAYSINASVLPDKIGWYYKSDSDHDYQLISSADFPDSKGGSDQASTSMFLADVTNYNVKLNLSALAIRDDMMSNFRSLARRDGPSAPDDRLRKEMMIRIDWTAAVAGQGLGFSQSGVFTVADARDGPLQDAVSQWMRRQPDARTGLEGTESSSPGSAPGSTLTPGTAGGSSNRVSQGIGSGLSSGAIAGIVVGVVLGLFLLVGGLVWLLFRRRRRTRQEKTDAAAQQASKASMDDGDLAAAKQAPDSPQSPYPDEVPPLPQNGAVSGATTGSSPHGTNHPPGYAARHLTGAKTRAQAPAGGVTSSVGYLVEDGMTDEEIRRLEEEERQLDAEIRELTDSGRR